MRKEDYQTMNCIFLSFRSFVPFVIVHLFSLQVLSCTRGPSKHCLYFFGSPS